MLSYTIYYNTLDYPGVYCVRKFEVSGGLIIPQELLGTAKSLEAARELVPSGLYPIPRSCRDDKNIIETWI